MLLSNSAFLIFAVLVVRFSHRVGTWNVDSLTGRSGELVDALGERRIDTACVQ